jgi:hypothetical protein
MKLKHKEIKELRDKMLLEQQHLCALCKEHCEEGDAVLDHDHKTGRIRGVLHRGCNALEGKISNNMPRNRVNLQRLEGIAQNIIKYLTQEREDIVHPTHKTAEERKLARKRRNKVK